MPWILLIVSLNYNPRAKGKIERETLRQGRGWVIPEAMAMIPKETIEEIRSRCNVVEVVGAYLPQLRRRGSTFKCNCPFHEEKTPSFTVNETRQIFHCFGCGIAADAAAEAVKPARSFTASAAASAAMCSAL